jgi:ABC-type Mn2+/Zn2+ transport system ATPase subunit
LGTQRVPADPPPRDRRDARWGDKPIVEDFSTRIFRRDRIGLIGPNGAGKTTLLRMLIGELLPDTGSVKLGANLVPVVIDQRRAALDPDKTPWEILADRNDHLLVRGRQMHVMSYLREYLFRDEQARQPVRSQLEGAVVQGISMATLGEITFKNGRASSRKRRSILSLPDRAHLARS